MLSGSSFNEDALLEYIEIIRYLEWQAQDLGERFAVAFGEALKHLLVFPESGRDLGRFDVRRMNLGGFSYHLIYRVEGDLLVVYAVAHHKRRPHYWLSRVM